MDQAFVEKYHAIMGGDPDAAYDLAYTRLSTQQITAAMNSYNPLNLRTKEDVPGYDVLRMMKTPEYLFWAAKMLLNLELHPFQAIMLEETWRRKFPMIIASRGASKSFMIAVFILLKLRLVPGSKIVVCGTAFRQSKFIYEYCVNIMKNADVYRSTFSSSDGYKREVDRCVINIGESVAYFVPIGNGESIRGLRATTVIADEFGSINPEIYETVISGFSVVNKNPVASSRARMKRDLLVKAGKWTADQEEAFNEGKGNQSIITGTCGYDFEHFARYWKVYKKIIQSRGNPNKLEEIGTKDIVNLDWKNFSIIRLPYELLPPDFMDDATISRAKASMTVDSYNREYATVFSKDSDGFFKKSLVSSCVASEQNAIQFNGKSLIFQARMSGDNNYKYVMGVDPASEVDNLAIVVLELQPDHTRVVYTWTINKKRFQEKVKAGIIDQHDYFQFCVEKIRDLCKAFNCSRIMMDAQGGGRTLQQALATPQVLAGSTEKISPIYEVIDRDKEKITDRMPGLHILEMCQFVNAKWTAEANHGLKFDLENKLLLFPDFDSVTLALSYQEDYDRIKSLTGKIDPDLVSLYDTLEDCVLEIEALKEELTTIVHSKTPTGVERWDTPESKMGQHKKVRQRKDRYSALVMANMAARTTGRIEVSPPSYSIYGVAVGGQRLESKDTRMYAGRINIDSSSVRVIKR